MKKMKDGKQMETYPDFVDGKLNVTKMFIRPEVTESALVLSNSHSLKNNSNNNKKENQIEIEKNNPEIYIVPQKTQNSLSDLQKEQN